MQNHTLPVILNLAELLTLGHKRTNVGEKCELVRWEHKPI